MCVNDFVWLCNFSLMSFQDNEVAKKLAPGNCVLQSSLRAKVRTEKKCFGAKKIWVGVANT